MKCLSTHTAAVLLEYIGCPTRHRTWYFFNNLTATPCRTTDTFLFISHTTNILLFKIRCNIAMEFNY